MLSGVELSEVFAVSPKRSAGNATLEALARAFVKSKPRRRKNVALVAWGDGDGGGASYVVGTLVAAEVPAGGGLRLQLAREGGQLAAERRPAGTAPGGAFSGQRCALLLDYIVAGAYSPDLGGLIYTGVCNGRRPCNPKMRDSHHHYKPVHLVNMRD